MNEEFNLRVLKAKAKLGQSYIDLCALCDEAERRGLRGEQASLQASIAHVDHAELALIFFT